jgi:Flp pilus assembly protein TadD
LTLQEFGRAIPDFDAALRFNPSNLKIYVNRGVSYMNLGDFDQALRDLNQAIEIDPSNAQIYINRAAVYAFQFRDDLAAADAERSIELGLEPDLALSVLAEVERQR